MSEDELYLGREQTLVKHFILKEKKGTQLES